MAPEDEPALPLEQEVLPDRADGLEPASVEPLRDPEGPRAAVTRLDRERLTDEGREARGGAVERISLGHATEGSALPVLEDCGLELSATSADNGEAQWLRQ